MKEPLFGGIDLGGSFIKYGLVDEGGSVVFKSAVPTLSGRRAILSQLIRVIDELRQQGSDLGRTLTSVGIGSPGIVDVNEGKIIGRSPNLPGWQGTEVARKLEEATNLKVVVDNDANVMALAEHRFGAGKGYSSGLYITVGTGIGSGIILDNRLWRGTRFAGAELGHTIIEKNGKSCKCGKRGCLELYASASAFISHYGRRIPDGAGVKYIFERARSGDSRAKAAIDKSADYLACGIGSALELLNPEIVVIGGGISAGGNLYFSAIRLSLKRYASRSALKGLIITRARLGNDAGLIGAALLAAEKEPVQ